MKNKLFIICPFSQMELYLQKKYGNEIYFITAPASVIQWNQKEYIDAIGDFIIRENIREIYLVNDTDCRFISNIINKKKLYGLYAEKIVEAIYIEHLFSCFKNMSLSEKKLKLAELNINCQIEELMKPGVLGVQILNNHIELKGIITTKKENSYKEINIQQLKNI